MNIHIQDPKVSLDNFDFVVIPEHDGVSGKNVITSKGAIHYLRNEELDQNINYLKSRIIQKKLVKLGNKIKTTGEYSVDIDLHPEVNCSLDIEILSPKTSA